MSERRRFERFAVADPWDGSVTVLRDVFVRIDDSDALTVTSLAAAPVGETVRLQVSGGGAEGNLCVQVLESRPVVLSGVVRHAVRLSAVYSPSSEPEALTGARGIR